MGNIGKSIFIGVIFVFIVFAHSLADAKKSKWFGFQLYDSNDDQSIREGTLIVRYKGSIEFPMAENIDEIWHQIRGRYHTVVLHLDSYGGEFEHTKKIISLLNNIRREVHLKTLVHHSDNCLSACLLVFLQGEERIAGSGSTWMIHGVCHSYTNIPCLAKTHEQLKIMRDAGVSEDFIRLLAERITSPGEFWLSGYELLHVYDAGIITKVIEAWQPQSPRLPPFDPLIRPR